MADVVVVGAGFAGLSAARELVRLGHDVVVLEGRDRVGGRSSPTTIAGTPVDLGGTFVGPTQDAVLALAAELGCETVPTYSARQEPDPLARPGALLSQHHSAAVDRRAARRLPDPVAVRADQPAGVGDRAVDVAACAADLDASPLDQWLRSVHASASTRDLMAIMARVTWGCEPDEVSMLHAVRYVKAAGGLGRMLDVEGGAQQDRFPAGTQQIAVRMADDLGERVVLDALVHRIERHPDGGADRRHRSRRRHRPRRHRGDPARAPRRHRVRSAAADGIPGAGTSTGRRAT